MTDVVYFLKTSRSKLFFFNNGYSKKKNLDLDVFKNNRSVSNIPFISKVLEKVAAKRLSSD